MADNREVRYLITGDASSFVKAAKEAKEAADAVGGSSGGGNGGGKKGSGKKGGDGKSPGGLPTEIKEQLAGYAAIEKADRRLNTLQGAQSYLKKTSQAYKDNIKEQENLFKANVRNSHSTKDYLQAVQKLADFQKQHTDPDRLDVLKSTEGQLKKNSQAYKDNIKEQENLYKSNVRNAKSAEAYVEAAQKLTDFQKQNAKVLNPGGRLSNIAMMVGGQALGAISQVGKQLSNQGGAYNQLNQQYTINPGLKAAQSNLRAAQLDLGSDLSGYEKFKLNAKAGLLSSGAAVPLAVAGDVAGAAGGAAGGAIQLYGALKAANVNPSILSGIGKVGAVGGAVAGGVGLGVLLGSTIKGSDPVDETELRTNPAALGHKQAAQQMADPGFRESLIGKNSKSLKEETDAMDRRVGLLNKLSDLSAKGVNRHDGKYQDTVRDLQKEYEKAGMGDVYKTLEKQGTFNDPNLVKALATSQSDVSRAMGGKGNGQQTILDTVLKSPEFKLQAQKIQSQIFDFNYDSSKQERLTKRDYQRGKEDRQLQGQRSDEDYTVTLNKIGIQRNRTVQDRDKATTRLNEDTSLTKNRTGEDHTTAVTKNELDVFRVKRDYALQSQRLVEDTNRQQVRLEQDSARQTSRIIEDSGRNLARLQEDTQRSRLRSAEDYNHSLSELNRNTARSNQDLDQSYKDSVVGLFAPSLANSKAYQFMKLSRDYKKQKGRVKEDSEFQKEGLDRQKKRSDEDIDTSESRGKSDISRERDRGLSDASTDKARAEEDIAREKTRQSLDLLQHETDSLKDSQTNLTEINRQYARTLEDADKNFSRNMADIQQQFSRSMADLTTEEKDATRQHARALEDLTIQERRAAQDFAEAMDDINQARSRFARDMNRSLTEMGQQLAHDVGLAAPVNPSNLAYNMGLSPVAAPGSNIPGGATPNGGYTPIPGTGGGVGLGGGNPNVGNGSGGGGSNDGSASNGLLGGLGGKNNNNSGDGSDGSGDNSGGGLIGGLGGKQKLPGYAVGTDFVPATGPALLHQGEAVIPRDQAHALRQAYDGSIVGNTNLLGGSSSGGSSSGGGGSAGGVNLGIGTPQTRDELFKKLMRGDEDVTGGGNFGTNITNTSGIQLGQLEKRVQMSDEYLAWYKKKEEQARTDFNNSNADAKLGAQFTMPPIKWTDFLGDTHSDFNSPYHFTQAAKDSPGQVSYVGGRGSDKYGSGGGDGREILGRQIGGIGAGFGGSSGSGARSGIAGVGGGGMDGSAGPMLVPPTNSGSRGAVSLNFNVNNQGEQAKIEGFANKIHSQLNSLFGEI